MRRKKRKRWIISRPILKSAAVVFSCRWILKIIFHPLNQISHNQKVILIKKFPYLFFFSHGKFWEVTNVVVLIYKSDFDNRRGKRIIFATHLIGNESSLALRLKQIKDGINYRESRSYLRKKCNIDFIIIIYFKI